MTAPTPRRRPPTPRRLLRPLLGAALVIAGILVPLEPAALPAPLENLAPDPAALAQEAPIVNGDAEDCPEGSSESPSGAECIRETPACLSPAMPGDEVLRLSVGYDPDLDLYEYPGFCEHRTFRLDDEDSYQCVFRGGFIVWEEPVQRVIEEETKDDHVCRIMQPAACDVGIRVSSTTCRAVERRTWQCEGGYKPTNAFNTCYKARDRPAGEHPACRGGAPDLVALRCDEYVGNDFVLSPGSPDWACASKFPTTGRATDKLRDTTGGVSSKHWCEFDSSLLKVVCHDPNPPEEDCAPTPAVCIKRASETGGCKAIADTIRCRAHQSVYRTVLAEYKMGEETKDRVQMEVSTVRSEGCEPCALLPFRSVPEDCPADLLEDLPSGSSPSLYDHIHRLELDFLIQASECARNEDGNLLTLLTRPECLGRQPCADPPRGRLSWTSTHSSRLAIVNSPVILNVLDFPPEEPLIRQVVYRSARIERPGQRYLPHPERPGGESDNLMHLYQNIPRGDAELDSVSGFGSKYGECAVRGAPLFKVRIEELWPDNPEHHAEILNLFGAHALAWWDEGLSEEERKLRTAARGLAWWDEDLSDEDRELRGASLTQELVCKQILPVWCRWSPTRSGYYKLTGAAAWIIEQWQGSPRFAILDPKARDLEDHLEDPDNRAALQELLDELRLDAEDVGLYDSLEKLLPRSHLSSDVIYASPEEQFACPVRDLRIDCGSSTDAGNYTETEPIGIMVHELRVVTRTPNS